MTEIKIPWAVWSEDEPSPEVMGAYQAYLRLAGGTNHPGYRQEIEKRRKRAAWILGHARAGWTETAAREAWDDRQTHLAAEAKLAAAEKAASDARLQQERWARYQARLPILEAEQRVRATRQVEMQPVFEKAGGRGRWCLTLRRGGRTYASIGREGGLSTERVRQLCEKEERLERRRSKWWHNRTWSKAETNRGRPIDLEQGQDGGPRDIWLTWYPPPDPRLDNMEPVTPFGPLQ